MPVGLRQIKKTKNDMTWLELFDLVKKKGSENESISIYDADQDEYFGVTQVFKTTVDDVLDEGALVLKIKG